MALPPVFAASALYDSLLQAALRQFFSRATFETEPIPSLSSDGRLAIEPTNDPSVLTIRWFGSRYVLHVPARRPFTPHEVRLAQAIGAVLALRYRAIFDPQADARAHRPVPRRDRGPLRQRVPRLAERSKRHRPRGDLFSAAIEVLRVAALSSYENHSISSGVLLLDKLRPRRHRAGDRGRRPMAVPLLAGADRHQELLSDVRRHPHAVPRQSRGLRSSTSSDRRTRRARGGRRSS